MYSSNLKTTSEWKNLEGKMFNKNTLLLECKYIILNCTVDDDYYKGRFFKELA